MVRTIVHIGAHKTGTTTIQGTLAASRDALLDAGIDFPLIGRQPNGAQAHRHFSAFMRDLPKEIPAGFEDAARAWTPEADVVVLSSEDFWFGSTERQIARLSALVPGIERVIFFSREPVSHLASLYKESLKGAYAGTVGDLLASHERLIRTPKAGFSYYRTDENISRWRQHFAVEVVRYHPGMDIFGAFFSAAGLDPHLLRDHGIGNLNVADTDVVCAIRLAVNRAMRDAKISAKSGQTLKMKLARGHYDDLEGRFRALLALHKTATQAFLETYRRHSPESALLHPVMPDEIAFAEFPDDAAAQVLASLTTP